MGFVFATTGKIWVERRSESVVLGQKYIGEDREEKPVPDIFGRTGNLAVEIGKETLAEILSFFDVPEHRDECGLEVPAYRTDIEGD